MAKGNVSLEIRQKLNKTRHFILEETERFDGWNAN